MLLRFPARQRVLQGAEGEEEAQVSQATQAEGVRTQVGGLYGGGRASGGGDDGGQSAVDGLRPAAADHR